MSYAVMSANEVGLVGGSAFFMKAASAAFDGDFERLNALGSAQTAGVDLSSGLNYQTGVNEVVAQTVTDIRQIEPGVGASLC